MAFEWSSPGSPQRPSFKDGGILVFVSNQHETGVTINFTVNQFGYFAISVSSDITGQADGDTFLVASSGSASVMPKIPVDAGFQGFNQFTNKVHIASVSPDYKGDLTGTDNGNGEFYTHQHIALYTINAYKANSNVMMAAGDQYDGNLDSNLNYVICGKLSNPVSRSSGGEVLGELPSVGVPREMLDVFPGSVTFDPVGSVTIRGDLSRLDEGRLGSVPRWYVPRAKVIINVSYADDVVTGLCSPVQDSNVSLLPARYQATGSNPASENSSNLHWEVSGSAQVGWNLADSIGQQRDATDLFIAGLLLGGAVSFLGVALDRAVGRKRDD